MDIAAGSLVLRAVKLTYDFWKEARTDALALSEDAKTVPRTNAVGSHQ